jgi:TetR/AcrR family transcriptional regulator, transcriptional repressor of bet genes
MAKKATVPRKRRPGRIAREADLLTKVYNVVSEVGIDAASMRQTADRSKVSTGTISYHFENKEKLVMAALQAAYQMPVPDDDANSSPLARVKAFAFRCILHEPNDCFWRFWMSYAVYGSRNAELRRHQNHWFRKKNSVWAKLVQEAARCGELSTGLDPIDTAEQLSIFTHGLMVRQILQPEPKTQGTATKLLAAYFDRLGGQNGRFARQGGA